MGDFSELEGLIESVGRKEETLRRPAALHFPLVQDYEAIARRVARQVLRALKPAGKEQAEWGVRVEALVRGVSASVMEDGIFLTMEPGESREAGKRDVDNSEVLDWIQAGLDEDGGDAKRISDEDRKLIAEHGLERGKRIIAMKVSRAFYSGNPKANYERMRRAIGNFLDGNAGDDGTGEALEAVLVAWEAAFGIRYPADMGENFRF